MIKCFKKIHAFMWILFFILPSPASSIETAPRISDREIIESLAELKQGQKELNRRFDDLTLSTDQRLAAMDNNVDQRFNDMSHRFDNLHNMILMLFGSVMALIIGLIGYMIWDRKTVQQPLKSKLFDLENELEEHLEMKHPSGSKLVRLILAFRKLAETDAKVAEILRTYSLL